MSGLLSLGIALALGGTAEAATYRCSPSGNDANDGIRAPWRTVQKAANTLRAGDTVVLEDGIYTGGVAHKRSSGREDAPITYQAEHPGKAVIRGGQIAFLIDNSDWVVLDGLHVRDGRTRGVRILVSHHVTVRNCISSGNGIEGLNSGFCNYLTLENNECYGNGKGYNGPEGYFEPGKGHGIYVACSGDRPIIRNNRSHDNGGCGIQLNANPRELYVLRDVKSDGIISEARVQDNLLYRNGSGGGAGINLMSVRDSLFYNNLLFNNFPGGICLFADYAGTAWGCRNNQFVNNTIYFKPNEGRYGFLFMEGSTGNTLQNNIVMAGRGPAIQFAADSAEFRSNHNVLWSAENPSQLIRTDDGSRSWTLTAWQKYNGRDRESQALDPSVALVSPKSDEPTGYMLAATSPGIGAGAPVLGLAALGGSTTINVGWSPVNDIPPGTGLERTRTDADRAR